MALADYEPTLRTPTLLDLVAERPRWMLDASCRGMPTEPFIVTKPTDDTRAICAGCEVRAECREAGIVDVDAVGLWGGLDANERARERRRRPKPPRRKRRTLLPAAKREERADAWGGWDTVPAARGRRGSAGNRVHNRPNPP